MPDGFRVLVIGAGLHGIGIAVNLKQAGIPFTVVETQRRVGGVWHENHYPGAGVDTPSHLYSFSFSPYDWTQYFAMRDELYVYFEHVADRFDLRSADPIRDPTVEAATYDAEAHRAGRSTSARPDGSTETLRANVVICGRRDLQPGEAARRFPARARSRASAATPRSGRTTSTSPASASPSSATAPAPCSSARRSRTGWIRSPSSSGRRSGPPRSSSSARSIPDPVRYLLTEVPLYRGWYRTRLGWTLNDRIYESLHKDPSWEHPERSLNATNDAAP